MAKKSIPGLLITFLLLLYTSLCLGDTIYLKNGEKIRSSYVEVKRDKIFFTQFGGRISLPMSLVDRVESDRFAEPVQSIVSAAPLSATPTTPATPAMAGSQQPVQESKEVDTEQEKKEAKYWIKKKQILTQRLAQAEKELQTARHDNFASRYAGGALERTIKRIEALEKEIDQIKQELVNLEDEARRYGIPPGVLRE